MWITSSEFTRGPGSRPGRVNPSTARSEAFSFWQAPAGREPRPVSGHVYSRLASKAPRWGTDSEARRARCATSSAWSTDWPSIRRSPLSRSLQVVWSSETVVVSRAREKAEYSASMRCARNTRLKLTVLVALHRTSGSLRSDSSMAPSVERWHPQRQASASRPDDDRHAAARALGPPTFRHRSHRDHGIANDVPNLWVLSDKLL